MKEKIERASEYAQELFARLDSETEEVHIDEISELALELESSIGEDYDDIEAEIEEYFQDKGVPINSGISDEGETQYR